MRAVRFHQTGAPEPLRCETLPIPRPGPGEVLVRIVCACGEGPHRRVWLGNLVRRGEVMPCIHDVLPLEQAAQTHRLMESRRVVGKLLLDPWLDGDRTAND